MPDHITPPEPKRRLRKPTNVSLPPALVAGAVAEARLKQWLEANREVPDFWNDEIDRKGLPLDDFRQF